VPVRNGTGQASATLKAPPRSIRWDKGDWILDITDFPRSTAMMQYQLVNDDDVLGRAEAVDVLAQRPADALALDALSRAARNDRFWAIRSRAVDAIGAWGSDASRAALRQMQTVKDALLRATFDPDARVRQEAAISLGHLPFSGPAALDIVVRIRSLARTDRSLIVRGAALAADLRLEKNAAVPLAKEMMAPDVWQNVIRGQALNALKDIDTPEARELIQRYAPPAQ
jgi:HEAT repeat protein